jgi:hypothetical protein
MFKHLFNDKYRENLSFLKQFLSLKNGIPSHDTINQVFQVLNLQQFEWYIAKKIVENGTDYILSVKANKAL